VNRLSELVLSLSKETRMQGLSRHSFSEGGWCGEGELKAPLYPIGQYIQRGDLYLLRP
jgi:hypothetical protein